MMVETSLVAEFSKRSPNDQYLSFDASAKRMLYRCSKLELNAIPEESKSFCHFLEEDSSKSKECAQ